jgi:carbon dioxide concentrating mechanism protein CcmN
MYLPPLQAVHNAELYQTGDVTVDPSAVIGLGVILQASPNGRIVIRAGACLGMGTIVNACEGTIEIESGAVLGPGVLMIGQGKVGANASIGAVSTIFNASIPPMQVLAAGSVIGQIGTQVLSESARSPTQQQSKVNPEISAVEAVEPTQSSPPVAESASSQPTGTTNDESPLTTDEAENSDPSLLTTDEAENSDPSPLTTDEAENSYEISGGETSQPQLTNDADPGSVPTPGTPIYGQIYISRMLGTIFPQGKAINRRP